MQAVTAAADSPAPSVCDGFFHSTRLSLRAFAGLSPTGTGKGWTALVAECTHAYTALFVHNVLSFLTICVQAPGWIWA